MQIVEKGLEHLFVTSISSHFFKTDFEQYLLNIELRYLKNRDKCQMARKFKFGKKAFYAFSSILVNSKKLDLNDFFTNCAIC